MNGFNPLTCFCRQLSDLAVIDMGRDTGLLKTLKRLKKRGAPRWWLSLDMCRECGQHWLVAAEEMQNDLYCLQRLNLQTAEGILEENQWPPDFDRYETLLEIGRTTGRRVRYAKGNESPLCHIITMLARDRPGIRVSELAVLLNLKPSVTQYLARQAIVKSEVNIILDCAT